MILISIDTDIFLHGPLHLRSNSRDFFTCLRFQNPIVDSLLLFYRQSLNGVSEARCSLLGRVLCSSDSGFSTEYEAFSQRVAAQTVCTVHAHASHLSCGEQSREACVAVNVSVNAAHHVMLPWPYWDHLMNWIDSQIFLR